MAITATMVRELREQTGAAMMDCKKALEAVGGDMQAAVDQLRKQGLKSAAKKAERETAEGRVLGVVSGDGRRGHMIGVACETDFLAASDKFKAFVDQLESHVHEHDPVDLDALLAQSWDGGGSVAEALKAAVGQFGENIRITTLVRLAAADGLVGCYVHHDKKQGAIVAVTTGADAGQATDTLRGLCQHIVVFQPAHARREDVPEEAVERERAVIRESDEVKKKPEEFRDKIVDGKLGKFYAGIVLEEQPWIHDDKSSVAKALAKDLGDGARVAGFSHVKLG